MTFTQILLLFLLFSAFTLIQILIAWGLRVFFYNYFKKNIKKELGVLELKASTLISMATNIFKKGDYNVTKS